VTTLAWAGAALAGDPVLGRALYENANGAPLGCAASSCHGPDPSLNRNRILLGAASPATIQRAITMNAGGMGFLATFLNATQLDHIASYIDNPSGGTAAPGITFSATNLAFGNQALGAASAAMTTTVTNSGSAPLSLSNIAIGGVHAGDFARAGNCAAGTTLPVGANCVITATFTPQAAGARTANITVGHNAAGGTALVGLSGTGAQSAPTLALSATGIRFIAAQLLDTTSAAQAVVLSNTGTAPLAFTSLTIAGTNAADFVRGGTCVVGTPLNPGATCTATVAFRPSATGTRTARLDIASGATGSPHSVSITGNGTNVSAPLVELSSASLALGNEVVGSPTAPKMLTITNTGSAPLAIAAIVKSGADFAHQSGCGASVAAGERCTVQVTFTPTQAGARAGALSIQSNAAGSPHAVQMSGVGFPTGTLSTVTFAPAAVTFDPQPVNTASSARTVTMTNGGPVPVLVQAVNLTGPNFAEFGRGSGTCAPNGMIPENTSCTFTVSFTPTAAGTRSATLSVASPDVSGNPGVALSGTGLAPAAPAATQAPSNAGTAATGAGSTSSNVGAGGCAMGDDGPLDPLFLMLALAAAFGASFTRRIPPRDARPTTDGEQP